MTRFFSMQKRYYIGLITMITLSSCGNPEQTASPQSLKSGDLSENPGFNLSGSSASNLGCFDKLLPKVNVVASGSVTGKTSGAVWDNNGAAGGVYMDTKKGSQDCSSRSANCAFVTLGRGSKSNGKNFMVNETIQVKSDFEAVVGEYKVTDKGVYDGYTYLKLTCPDLPVVATAAQPIWVQTNGGECNAVCRSVQRVSGRSPKYKNSCVSGEVRGDAVGIKYLYGTYSNGVEFNQSMSVGNFCYGATPFKKQMWDGDRTDITVGCYCL